MRVSQRLVRTATAVLIAVPVSGLSVLVATPASAAASPAAVAYPLVTPMSVGAKARMVYADGHLFVTRGPGHSDVQVYSTAGSLVHDITGEAGAFGMVLSADASTLYVADSTGTTISAINTTTYAHTEITVDGCPTSLALAAGRLFYSWGCQPTQDNSGVSSIDPASPQTAPVPGLSPNFYQAPTLAGGGTTLAVSQLGSSSGDIETYTADPSGTLTLLADSSVRTPADLAVSPDGNDVLVPQVVSGLAAAELAASSLATGAQYKGGTFSSAVAYSPDGNYLVDGLQAAGDTVNLFKRSDTTALWRRSAGTVLPSSWAHGVSTLVLPGSLSFAPDDSRVYGLIYKSATQVWLFASVLKPTHASAPRLSLSASDHSLIHTAAITTSQREPIVVAGTYGHHAARELGVVETKASGTTSVKIKTPYNGSVQVAFEGTASLYPAASADRVFTVPTTASISLSGAHTTRGGVEVFTSVKKVRFLATVTPVVINRPVTVDLQQHVGGGWRTVGSARGATNKKGVYHLRLASAQPNVVFRVKLVFHGDQYNPKTSAVSRSFEIS